jgi:hypothetical protein
VESCFASAGLWCRERLYVHTQYLGPQQVVTWFNVRNVDVVSAFGVNELIDSPVRGRAGVLPEFDPDISRTIGCSRGHINQDRALVRGSNDIITGSSRVVVPFNCASLSGLLQTCRGERKGKHVSLSPGLTVTFCGAATLLTLQAMADEVRSFTGLLLGGQRMYMDWPTGSLVLAVRFMQGHSPVCPPLEF